MKDSQRNTNARRRKRKDPCHNNLTFDMMYNCMQYVLTRYYFVNCMQGLTNCMQGFRIFFHFGNASSRQTSRGSFTLLSNRRTLILRLRYFIPIVIPFFLLLLLLLMVLFFFCSLSITALKIIIYITTRG